MSESVLLVAVLVSGLSAIYLRLRDRLDLGRRLSILALAIGLGGLAIPGLHGGFGRERAALVVVIDASFSMGPRLEDALDLDRLRDEGDRDLLIILAGTRALALFHGAADDLGGALAAPLAFRDPLFRARADLDAALDLAGERFGERSFELVLVSDGGFDEPSSAASSLDAVRVIEGPLARAEDIGLEFTTAPPVVSSGRPLSLQLRLSGRLDAPRRVGIRLNDRSGPEIELRAGVVAEDIRFELRAPWPEAGFFRATLEPAGADADPDNDEVRLPFLVTSDSPIPVLLLQGVNGDPALREFLAQSPRFRLLAAASGLDQARLVVVDSLPAESLPVSEVDLDRFVRTGGGLFLCGVDQAFGAGGWDGGILDRLSPLRSRPGRKPRLLRFALDRSGSMASEGRLSAAASSVRALFKSLGPEDRLELILFAASRERKSYDRGDPEAGAGLARDLDSLGAAGGTDLRALLEELAEAPAAGEEHEVLTVIATDGRDPRGLDQDFVVGLAARMKVAGLGLQIFWFDRDEALRPALEMVVGSPGRLQEVDDFGQMLEPFFAALGEELSLTDVSLRRRGGAELVLRRLLQTRRGPEAEILVTGGENETALARTVRGLGRVAACPADPTEAVEAGVFDSEGRVGQAALAGFLAGLVDRPAGQELRRLLGDGGERLELEGPSLPLGPLVLVGDGEARELRRVGRDRARSGPRARSAAAGIHHLLDAEGRDLGALLLGPPGRRDLGPPPEAARLLALALRLGSEHGPRHRPRLLLPFALILLFAIDLVLRSRES